MDIIELIQVIERRPGMYVDPDANSIETLYSFIMGFACAKRLSGLIDERDTLFLEKFYPWLQEKYSLEDSASWTTMIETVASRQSSRPLDVFFAEFKDFLQGI